MRTEQSKLEAEGPMKREYDTSPPATCIRKREPMSWGLGVVQKITKYVHQNVVRKPPDRGLSR